LINFIERWINNTLAIEWLNKVFFPSTAHLQGRPSLIVDGHGSHLQRDFIALCMIHDTDLLILSPHSSHVSQLLDCNIFAPLKASVSKQAARYSDTDIRRVQKLEWATFFQKARTEAMTKKNVMTWMATGIYPSAPAKLIPPVEPSNTPPRGSASTWIPTPFGSLTSADEAFFASHNHPVNPPEGSLLPASDSSNRITASGLDCPISPTVLLSPVETLSESSDT
jgi:hypothetical protein